MRYDAFFKAFYIGEHDGCLKHHTTTIEIPQFFIDSILVDEESRKKLPTDDSSYDKWFQGNSSPRNHWANLSKNFHDGVLVKALLSELDDENLRALLTAFDAEEPEAEINKELLATAIEQQFKAIIDGKGNAEDLVADIYMSGNIKADFAEYIDKAIVRYSSMRLIGGEEVPFEDFFVCNTIGEKERVFADKTRIKCLYLEDTDLTGIRNIYQKRGYDNLRTVLLGSGGCGKTLMLQYLFLKSARGYKKTGILPIFLELRYFTQNDDLMSFIVKTVNAKDEKFTEEAAHRLFLSGRCQLLLDGFDEIDPSDIGSFLQKLEAFLDKYTKVQVVLSSRENDSLTGLHNFIKLYMWPFDMNQSIRLIEKILRYKNEPDEKDTVLEYVNNGFLKKDGIFASHPLLLTYVTMEYPSYKRFNGDHLLFYKLTYEALLSGHDDNKKPYDRVFKSVDDATQFSTVFKEFCAITFKDGRLEFDSATFEEYFNKLKSQQAFENPHKMNIKNFKHDVCSTACMMYEKEYDIFYIDPGIQEFLFAEYYAQAEVDEMKVLEEDLEILPYSKVLRLESLDMLSKRVDRKFKKCVLLPFLDKIFKVKDQDAFARFWEVCFDEVNVLVHDTNKESKTREEKNLTRIMYPQVENHPKTILLSYVLKEIGVELEYPFVLNTANNVEVPDEAEATGCLIGGIRSVNDQEALFIDNKPYEVMEFLNPSDWVTDSDGKISKFGEKYTLDTYDISLTPSEFTDIFTESAKLSTSTYGVFERIQTYYKRLQKEQHRYEHR